MKLKRNPLRIILVAAFVSVFLLIFFIPKPPLLNGISFSTTVYDEQGHLLRLSLSHDDKFRVFTPLSQINNNLIAATLLQEDQYFYQHPGINPWTIIHSAWATYIVHSRRMGGSTISMQLARMRYGIHSKTLSGKLLQIYRALQLERHYSKDQILEAYLNLAPYGGNIEGVGAASLIYFDKPAEKLALSEALALTVIPQNPNQRALGKDKLRQSRQLLFTRWLEQHPEDKELAMNFNLPVVMRSVKELPFIAPHFVNDVLNDQHFTTHEIHTTLDSKLQRLLERLTQQYLKRQALYGVHNAAVLLVDTRDHSIKAMVGSGNFFDKSISGQINGTQAKRSPGSTLKPFIYGLALDQGLIHPNTVLSDVPHRFGAYNPENFDYDFMGPVKAKDALILSRNIPAISLASQLQQPDLHEFLSRAHVRDLKPASYYGLALSLGGAELSMQELTSLYMMLANEGLWYPLRNRADMALGHGERLLSPEASFLIEDMLQQTQRPGASMHANTQQNLPVAWKTGTSSGFRDAWTVGHFGPYVMAVWLGNFNNDANPVLIGKNIAAPLFFNIVEGIQQEQEHLYRPLKNPAHLNLTQIDFCKASGLLPTRYCKERESGWFIPGVSPITTDTIYREIAIDAQSGLRTCHYNENTRFEIYEFWPSDLLRLFKRAGIQRRSPPAFDASCSSLSQQGLAPHITNPQQGMEYIIPSYAPEGMTIPLSVTTDGDVHKVYWFINDTYLGTTAPETAFLWKAKAGQHILRVVDEKGRSDVLDIQIKILG